MEVLKYEKTRYKTPDQWIVNRLEIKIVKNLLQKYSEKMNILNIPCGYGRMSSLLNKKGNVVHGDIDRNMVKRTSMKIKGMGVVCDVRNLPFKKGSFDLVFVVRLFQHLDKNSVNRAISEIFRITWGNILFSFYRDSFLHRLERFLTRRKSNIKFYRIHDFQGVLKKFNSNIISLLPLIHAQTFVLCSRKR